MSDRTFNLPQPGDNENDDTLADLQEQISDVTEMTVAPSENISSIRTMERGSVSYSARTIALPSGQPVQLLGADPYRTKAYIRQVSGPGGAVFVGSYSDVAARSDGPPPTIATGGGVPLSSSILLETNATDEMYAILTLQGAAGVYVSVWSESDR